jgi:hypothetical protein
MPFKRLLRCCLPSNITKLKIKGYLVAAMHVFRWVFMGFFVLFTMLSSINGKAQAIDLNDLFTDYNAITFFTNDSANFIYPEATSIADLQAIIKKDCPFTLQQAEHPENIHPIDTLIELQGLHTQMPQYDTILQEVKGFFLYDTIQQPWYAYCNHSKVDSGTAFLIIPGTGIHNGLHIAEGDTANYQNLPKPIKEVCLPYGDVFTYVKPNEDFRNIWRNTGASFYKKLNYNYFTPYTDVKGKPWGANMTIECIALVKYLKLKYQKVIVLGLSNAGFPALIAALEGGANGVNCASGLSVASYSGFPLNNFENPYYTNQFTKYALDSLAIKWMHSLTYTLFSYGDNDGGAIDFEYQTHSLEDSLASLNKNCQIDFTYNFSGHHYPVAYLDTFIQRVKHDSCQLHFTTNLQTNESNTMQIYPNPVSSQLYVSVGSETLTRIRIFNTYGSTVFDSSNLNRSQADIFLGSWASGMYWIEVSTAKHRTVRKIMKD